MEERKPYSCNNSAEIESTDLYRRATDLADEIWLIVRDWVWYAKKTVGIQLVTAMDSLPANLVEGDGRWHERDALRFIDIGRASGREARHWIERAVNRELIAAEMAERWLEESTQLIKMTQGLVRYRLKRSGMVRESTPSDPLIL